jgi:hypothetical protein
MFFHDFYLPIFSTAKIAPRTKRMETLAAQAVTQAAQ